MSIRAATKADCTALEALWSPMVRDTLVTFNSQPRSRAEIEAMVDEKAAAGHAFLVAEVAPGQVAGFATYGQFRGGVGYAHTMEHTIILAPAAHGKGLGRTLMAGIEDHARSRGVHSMFAGVSAGNPAGVAFHARLGYAEVARLPEVGRKFDRWLDLILMQKFL